MNKKSSAHSVNILIFTLLLYEKNVFKTFLAIVSVYDLLIYCSKISFFS